MTFSLPPGIKGLKHVHMTYSFLVLLIFLLSTLVNIYYLEFISHHIKEILYVNTNSYNHFQQTFSFVSHIDVEKYFNLKSKIHMNNFS